MLWVCGWLNAQQTQNSKVEGVRLFPQSAEVTRSLEGQVKKGYQEIVIDHVSPYLDVNSLQVNALGELIVLDVSSRYFTPEPIQVQNVTSKVEEQKLQVFKDSIQRYDDALRLNQYYLETYQAEKQMLLNNGAVKGHGRINDSIELLQSTLEFYRAKMMEIQTLIYDLNINITRLQKRKSFWNDQYQQYIQFLQGAQKGDMAISRQQIVVRCQGKQSGPFKLEVKYMVSQAGWTPSYDLRANSETSQLKLVFKANIYQNTGENWDMKSLILSTYRPSNHRQIPQVNPWIAYQYPVRADVYLDDDKLMEQEESVAMTYNAAPSAVSKARNALEKKAEKTSNYTQTQTNLLQTEYKVDLPYLLESGPNSQMLLVYDQTLKTQFKHFAIPRLSKEVFINAEIWGWRELQLLAANARMYLDGAFIGNQYINPFQQEDTMQIVLGVDPYIEVERTVKAQDLEEKKLGKNTTQSYAVEIKVKNQKKQTVVLELWDQVPISTLEDFNFTWIQKPKAIFEAEEGLIKYQWSLQPGVRLENNYVYKLKVNEDQGFPAIW